MDRCKEDDPEEQQEDGYLNEEFLEDGEAAVKPEGVPEDPLLNEQLDISGSDENVPETSCSEVFQSSLQSALHESDDGQSEEDEPEASEKKYSFLAEYVVKKYTRQKTGVCINNKKNIPEKVTGNSLSEVLQCIWNYVKPHLCREVDVSESSGIEVSWSEKQEPDIRDIYKFVYLRDSKRKTIIKLDQLGDGKIMLHWREKTIIVCAFVYSQSVSSVAIWEEVNKRLLKPTDTDRAGAPTTVILDELVEELKEKNAHLQSHDSGWIQWATYIHASPAHLQAKLKVQMPPAEMRGMFWSLPTSESSRLECTRQGLSVAQNVVDNLTPSVQFLCERAEQLANAAFEQNVSAKAINERLDMCRQMLKAMQTSTAPEESFLSNELRGRVGDMMDIDHQ